MRNQEEQPKNEKRFIVADILPPTRQAQGGPVAHTASARLPVRASRKPAAKKSVSNAESALRLDGPSPKIDEWFKRGKEERGEAPPTLKDPELVEGRRPVLHKDSPTARSTVSSSRFLPLLVLCLAVVLGGGYSVARAFSKLHITIELRTETVGVNKELAVSSSAGVSDLRGELISLTHIEEGDFPATGSENVNKKASGIIVIFNSFDAEPQVLVANTRFQAHNGKIYRIPQSVTVPGLTVKDGKQVPGSIEVTVIADQPGPDSNQGLTDFTIPGFQGTPKFEDIYARSKTKIEGGVTGKAKVVTQDDIDAAQRTLEQNLKEKAKADLLNAIPGGFVLSEGAYEITTDKREFSKEVGDPAESLHAKFTVNARGLVIREEDLARVLAEAYGLPADKARLSNLQDISIEVIRRNIQSGTMQIRVTGNALFSWDVDDASLKQQIIQAGDPGQFNQVFQSYTAIQRAEARFSPSWIRNTPTTPEDIIIEYTKPL